MNQTSLQAPIPFIDIKGQYERLKPQIDSRMSAVLNHGKFILGPEVNEFENALADFAGAEHAVSVANGTDALLIALMAEGVTVGDAVFLPSFTFTATAGVIIQCGATPVFCDVKEADFSIDLESLQATLKSVRQEGVLRPRAVIAVDLFGLPSDYKKLRAFADENELFLISDAAQSFGAKYQNQRVGTLAPATTTSFFPAKPLGCYGDGGAILTNSAERAEIYQSIRAHGQGREKYDVTRFGFNSRLDTLQAAVLLAKLEVFEEELSLREQHARHYDKALAETPIVRPRYFSDRLSAWAQYSVLLNDRDGVARLLKEAGVPTAIYYPKPMHAQSAYAQFSQGSGSLPVSEDLSRRILSIPLHPYMESETVSYVADKLISAVASLS